MVTGALGVVIGLSLPWAVLAIILGNLIGPIFMALHSAQGPRLGIPQMIQSRAQFGFYGAILPIVIAILQYTGFFISSGILGGDALSGATGIGVNPSIVIVAAACVVLAVIGYRMIHGLERHFSYISAAVFLFLTIELFTRYSLGHVWHAGPMHPGLFVLMVAIAATWSIGYAPYVADYSRYLPKSASIRACFWWTYGGTAISSAWMMFIGAAAVAFAGDTFQKGSTSFVVDLAPGGLHWLISIVIIVGIVAINVLNLYGAFMSTVTIGTAIWPVRRVGRSVRIGGMTAIAVIGAVLAIVGRNSFISSYENFILFILYFLIPWTAINLVDFYLVRKHRYHIDDIYDPRGRYGAVNWRAMLAYVLGIAVEIPFMSTTFYTGFMVKHLGGADISWVFGLIVASVVYYVTMRPVGSQMDEPATEPPRPVQAAN
jgi:NCS1 family nucleobase:cation symporter-1